MLGGMREHAGRESGLDGTCTKGGGKGLVSFARMGVERRKRLQKEEEAREPTRRAVLTNEDTDGRVGVPGQRPFFP